VIVEIALGVVLGVLLLLALPYLVATGLIAGYVLIYVAIPALLLVAFVWALIAIPQFAASVFAVSAVYAVAVGYRAVQKKCPRAATAMDRGIWLTVVIAVVVVVGWLAWMANAID
jgi:hypothetical protein